MRTPMTSRRCAEKTFYVFFALNGEYGGCYDTIQASSYEKAWYKAMERYGMQDFVYVSGDKEQAEGRIKAFGLREIAQ